MTRSAEVPPEGPGVRTIVPARARCRSPSRSPRPAPARAYPRRTPATHTHATHAHARTANPVVACLIKMEEVRVSVGCRQTVRKATQGISPPPPPPRSCKSRSHSPTLLCKILCALAFFLFCYKGESCGMREVCGSETHMVPSADWASALPPFADCSNQKRASPRSA